MLIFNNITFSQLQLCSSYVTFYLAIFHNCDILFHNTQYLQLYFLMIVTLYILFSHFYLIIVISHNVTLQSHNVTEYLTIWLHILHYDSHKPRNSHKCQYFAIWLCLAIETLLYLLLFISQFFIIVIFLAIWLTYLQLFPQLLLYIWQLWCFVL